MEVRFDLTLQAARKFVLGLLLFSLAMAGIYLANLALPDPSEFIHLMFDLDSERSIPTWFSSIQLFLVGLVFLLIAHRKRTVPAQVSSHFPLSLKFLVTAGLIFIFFSMDEAAMFHERLKFLLGGLSWIPRFDQDLGLWMSIYAVAGLVVLLFLIRDVWSLLRYLRRAAFFLVLGFSLFVVGGVLVEGLANLFLRGDEITYLHYIQVALEEVLEMAGVTVILYGAVHIGNYLKKAREVVAASVLLPVGRSSPPLDKGGGKVLSGDQS